MLRLAVPVVLAELGWITMGMVDILMVGRLGPEAIGAVGIGSAVFLAFAVFGMGLLLGLDTLVSQAFGAQRIEECHRWLAHGVWLSLALTVPMSLMLWGAVSLLRFWGLHPDVLRLTEPYLAIVTWSGLPLLLYASFRRYLQSMNVVRPIMVALATANLINVVANWILVFGHLGSPALGVNGAAWATCLARVYMALFLLATIWRHEARSRTGLLDTPIAPDPARMRTLLRLGFPAAMQITLEVGVFAAATALAGRLDPAALAAHQIAINIAGFTFMVPLGVSSAGAVRVGQAIGRRDVPGASRSGWAALLIGTVFMTFAAVTFLVFPRPLMLAFTADHGVVSTGIRLLFVAAVFQLFDGLQAVSTGVLRGLGDTRTPMVWNLAGHWFFGLPLGYALCFAWGVGVIGLWIGLSSGLIIVGAALVLVWMRRIRALHRVAAGTPG